MINPNELRLDMLMPGMQWKAGDTFDMHDERMARVLSGIPYDPDVRGLCTSCETIFADGGPHQKITVIIRRDVVSDSGHSFLYGAAQRAAEALSGLVEKTNRLADAISDYNAACLESRMQDLVRRQIQALANAKDVRLDKEMTERLIELHRLERERLIEEYSQQTCDGRMSVDWDDELNHLLQSNEADQTEK